MTPLQQYVINYAYGTTPKPTDPDQQNNYAYQFFIEHDKLFVRWVEENPDNEVIGFIVHTHMIEMQKSNLWTIVHQIQKLIMTGVSIMSIFKTMLQFTVQRTGKEELTSEEMPAYLDTFHAALNKLTPNDPNSPTSQQH